MSDNNIDISDEFIQKFKISKEYKELFSILAPMIESIRTSPSSAKIFTSCANIIIRRSAIQYNRLTLLRKTLKFDSQDEVQTLQNALFYLGFFEISVSNILDQLITIFISNNHDFYVFLKKGYAKKFEDIEKALLYEKLDFLKHHGINLPVINFRLRNKIAHMDFDILPNSKVLVDGREYDLKLELVVLSCFVFAFTTVLKDAHFPEIMKEIAKKGLKKEKSTENTKLVF